MDPNNQFQPMMQNESQMATPEQKAYLMNMISATREKVGDLNTAMFSVNNSGKQLQSEALKEIFSLMLQAGVDLSSQESVAAFLERLKENNPELAQTFEEILNSLLEDVPETNQEINMNNENISENLRGSSEGTSGSILG